MAVLVTCLNYLSYLVGFVCVRGFDQQTRAPRPLMARLHFPVSKLKRTRGKPDEDQIYRFLEKSLYEWKKHAFMHIDLMVDKADCSHDSWFRDHRDARLTVITKDEQCDALLLIFIIFLFYFIYISSIDYDNRFFLTT